MKRGILCVAVIAGAVATVTAQQRGGGGMTATAGAGEAQVPSSMNIVRPRMAVESRITKNAPYSGEAVNEFVQTLSDGNRITRKTVTKTYRDSEGRTRREQTITNWSTGTETTTIMIGDPVAGLSFVLEPETRTAYRETQIVARAVPSTDMPAPGARGWWWGRTRWCCREVLRTGGLDGHDAADAGAAKRCGRRGRCQGAGPWRYHRTARPEDHRGGARRWHPDDHHHSRRHDRKQQPIKVISEQWISQDLQVLVSTRHSDPRSGETVYTAGQHRAG